MIYLDSDGNRRQGYDSDAEARSVNEFSHSNILGESANKSRRRIDKLAIFYVVVLVIYLIAALWL